MEIPKEYQIIDYRSANAFKKTTFGNYQKSDVLSAFQKSITNSNVNEACHWMVELLVSGYVDEIWFKLLILHSKLINIANPLLSQYIYYRYNQYLKLIDNPNFSGEFVIKTRNVQELRNHLAEITGILAISPKNVLSKTPKITKEEFRIDNFKCLLNAVEYKLVDHICMYEDPSEVKVVANEIAYHLRLLTSSFDKCNYWIHWLLEWEKFSSKKIGKFQCGQRQKSYIKPQFHHDFIWLIWDVVFQEVNSRKNTNYKTQIKYLYELYCYHFSISNKKKKIYLLLHSFLLLTMDVNWTTSIISNYPLILQTSANINLLFAEYKKIEESKNVDQELPYKVKSYDNYLIPINNNGLNSKMNTNKTNQKKKKNKKNKFNNQLSYDSKNKFDYIAQIQSKLYDI